MMYLPQDSGAMIFFRDSSDSAVWVLGFDLNLLQIWAGSTRMSLSSVVCTDIHNLRETIKQQIRTCSSMNYYISNVLSLDFEEDIQEMRLIDSGFVTLPIASQVEIDNFLSSHGLFLNK